MTSRGNGQVGGAVRMFFDAMSDPEEFASEMLDGDDDEVLIGADAHGAGAEPPCATCSSKRVLGAKGHQIPCPLCRPEEHARFAREGRR